MRASLYTPNSISIPADLPYRRCFVNNFDLKTSGAIEDISAYDSRTLFYDVFFASNSQCIRAVGPPLLNLAKELPFRILHRGKEVCYHLEHFLRCTQLYVDQCIEEPVAELLFDFGSFSKKVRVQQTSLSPFTLVVMCMQKDLKARWVRSWCQWYKELYGAQIILYDNGSTNLAEVLEAIADFDPIVIQWNFPFGPSNGSFYNCFSQIGAYNHCLLKYPFRYGMVFDSDEYLISRSDPLNFLRLNKGVDVFLLESYYIPNVRDVKEDYGVEDYVYRPKNLRDIGRKYMFVNDRVRYLGIHNAIVPGGNIMEVPEDIAYFNHYKGLNTNWKSWEQRDVVEEDMGDLVLDSEAKKLMEKLGLGS